jgi:tetratricopeptide (TPR) repeat protein
VHDERETGADYLRKAALTEAMVPVPAASPAWDEGRRADVRGSHTMHGWHTTFDQSGAAAMTTQPSDARPGLTSELEEAIRRGYAQRDRADMGPTIAYFESLLAEHPGHPVLVYEVAGAYDTAGQEEKARELYERALDLGLAGDTLRRCLCQYGSTLRWLGQYNASLAALDRAKRQWPESDAVRVFRALTLNDAGRSDEAVAELMTVITAHAEVTDLGRWAEGLRGLAQWLADGRPDSLLSHDWNPADRREFTGAH